MKKLSGVLFFFLLIIISINGSGDINLALRTSGYSNISINHNLQKQAAVSEQIRLNLCAFHADGSPYVLDGTLTKYSPEFSNAVDRYDSRKLFNSGENVSIVNGTYNLIIESRATISNSDSINFRIWGLQKKSYRLEFIARALDHPGLLGYLEDNYLHTSTVINLNDTSRITIEVNNDPGSYAQNRFKVIFKTIERLVSIPENFTFLKAVLQNNLVNMEWNTLNQNDMNQYYVERSADSTVFNGLNSFNTFNLSSHLHRYTDYHPVAGTNFYRIRSVNKKGTVQYSNCVKVNFTGPTKVQSFEKKTDIRKIITIFPNPATPDNLNLTMAGQQHGMYRISLVNSFGDQIMKQVLIYKGAGIQKLLIPKSVPAGYYYLEIINPAGEKKVIQIIF